MHCGNRDIRVQTIHDGLAAGAGELHGHWVCDRCGHVGPPLMVDADAPEPSERWDSTPPKPYTGTFTASSTPHRPYAVLLIVAGALMLVPGLLFASTISPSDGISGVLYGLGAIGFAGVIGFVVMRVGWNKWKAADVTTSIDESSSK